MRLRVVALIVLVLAASAALTQPTASAAQHWTQIDVSRDGRHWSATLETPLFEKPVVLVPGAEVTETLYVTNRGNETARLRVSVLVDDRTGFLDATGFRMQVRAGDQAAHRITHAGRDLAGVVVLDPDDVVPVTVRISLLRSETKAMDQHLGFQLQLTELQPDKG